MVDTRIGCLLCIVIVALVAPTWSQDVTTTASPTTTTEQADPTTTTAQTTVTATTTSAPATTLSPEEECARLNSSCKDCVGNSKCMYCYTDNTCMLYPTGHVLPPSSDCALDKARWGTCLVNFEALIISMSVIGGVILFTIIGFCVYCCCCKKGRNKKHEREDAKYESQRMERKAKQDERRNERRSRLDEIRMKYGLMKDGSGPYSRFDA